MLIDLLGAVVSAGSMVSEKVRIQEAKRRRAIRKSKALFSSAFVSISEDDRMRYGVRALCDVLGRQPPDLLIEARYI